MDGDPRRHFAAQAGGFESYRYDDGGTWVGDDDNPCSDEVVLTAGGPQGWTADRTLILLEPVGHGDSGRPTLGDACDLTPVSNPNPVTLLYDYLDTVLPPL